MPAEHEDHLDYRSAAMPIVHAIERHLSDLRVLLRSADGEEPGDGDTDGRPHVGPHDVLTPREQEVLSILVQGAPNRAIARSLDISIPTVKAHLGSIFSKLEVNGRAEAISRVLSDVDDHGHTAPRPPGPTDRPSRSPGPSAPRWR